MSDDRFWRKLKPIADADKRLLETLEQHNHGGYMRRHLDLLEEFDMLQAEGGSPWRAGSLDEQLDRIEAAIDENIAEARDRWDDWASDPLP